MSGVACRVIVTAQEQRGSQKHAQAQSFHEVFAPLENICLEPNLSVAETFGSITAVIHSFRKKSPSRLDSEKSPPKKSKKEKLKREKEVHDEHSEAENSIAGSGANKFEACIIIKGL